MADHKCCSKMSEELVVQILSRLPPKSLMRFKSIQKSWYVLMNNPNFINLHLTNSNSPQAGKLSPSATIVFRRFVLEDLDSGDHEIRLSSFNLCLDHIDDVDMDGGDDHLHSVVEDLKIPPSMGPKTDDFEISSQCDGIVCLTDYKHNICLCNPSIKEFKLVPESEMAVTSPEEYPTAAVGLGCDIRRGKNNNYKVVRLLHFGRKTYEDDRVVMFPPKAEVYTLTTNSWREVEIGKIATKTGFHLPHRSSSICCKGFVYWFAVHEEKEYVSSYTDDDDYYYDEEDNNNNNDNDNEGDDVDVDGQAKNTNEPPNPNDQLKQGLLSFDLEEEVFDIISYPPDANIPIGYYDKKMFAVWNESFALVTQYILNSIDIWVMVDKGSWIKYLAVEPEMPLEALSLGKIEDDGVVLVATDRCVIIFYNVCSTKFKYLVVHGEDLDRIQAFVCASSIVSIQCMSK